MVSSLGLGGVGGIAHAQRRRYRTCRPGNRIPINSHIFVRPALRKNRLRGESGSDPERCQMTVLPLHSGTATGGTQLRDAAPTTCGQGSHMGVTAASRGGPWLRASRTQPPVESKCERAPSTIHSRRARCLVHMAQPRPAVRCGNHQATKTRGCQRQTGVLQAWSCVH